jgi:glutathione S-transferase
MKPMFMKKTPDETLVNVASHNFARFGKVLNETLATREYVTGTLSIADFAISTIAMYRLPAQMDTKPFPHLEAYLARMESRESWKQTLPQF